MVVPEASRGWPATCQGRQADAGRNLVIRVPATAGREDAPVVTLQAHLDMVCEREPDSAYDPRAGRILVVVDGDWVVAPETTMRGEVTHRD